MAKADDNTLKLQVASAQPQDAVYGLARFPRNAMASLCITEGQIVELVGRRHAAAIAVDSYPRALPEGGSGLGLAHCNLGARREAPSIRSAATTAPELSTTNTLEGGPFCASASAAAMTLCAVATSRSVLGFADWASA